MEGFKKFIAFFAGCIVALLILEIFLRTCLPSPVSVRSNEIILRSNTTLKNLNPPGCGLDSIAFNRLNSIGFRGAEIPENFESYCSVITVGGSTTFCRNLDEGRDWPHVFKRKIQEKSDKKFWLNNAGIDGNSTYAHLILLRSHIAKIKPDYVFYLVGINEIERADLHEADLNWNRNKAYSFKNWLKKNSETALFIETLYRRFMGYQLNMTGEMQSIKNPYFTEIDSLEIERFLKNQRPFLKDYKNRLTTLISETKKADIQPILITQPFLFGEGIDPKTGINLETIKTWQFENGKARWSVLESYNDITRKVAAELKIPMIDLARKMPKSTEYFFDSMHFTNAGAEKVAEILAENWP